MKEGLIHQQADEIVGKNWPQPRAFQPTVLWTLQMQVEQAAQQGRELRGLTDVLTEACQKHLSFYENGLVTEDDQSVVPLSEKDGLVLRGLLHESIETTDIELLAGSRDTSKLDNSLQNKYSMQSFTKRALNELETQFPQHQSDAA